MASCYKVIKFEKVYRECLGLLGNVWEWSLRAPREANDALFAAFGFCGALHRPKAYAQPYCVMLRHICSVAVVGHCLPRVGR
jgi:hypothetical protein